MRVLYVSHTARISGGERSLLELLPAVSSQVGTIVATPEGELWSEVQAIGVPVRRITGTDGSLKLHPIRTPRTAVELGRAAWCVSRICRRDRVDLIHANSIRAGIVAVGAARLGGAPVVVHVRDVLPDGPLTRLTRAMIGAGASAIVGNSSHTLARFCPPRTDALLGVAHSPVDLARLHAAAALDPSEARAALGMAPHAGPVLGVVGQLTPWKGQDDAVRVIAGLRSVHPGVRLLLVGSPKFVSPSTRYDNVTYVRRLRALVDELNLRDHVVFLGERRDVPRVLRALDMLLVPSWEEPFGRTVVEALAAGVPVAATSAGGPREVLRDGVDGLLLPPRSPGLWVQALSGLLGNPARLAEMAHAGTTRAAAFGPHAHAAHLISLYGALLEGGATRSGESGRAPRGVVPARRGSVRSA